MVVFQRVDAILDRIYTVDSSICPNKTPFTRTKRPRYAQYKRHIDIQHHISLSIRPIDQTQPPVLRVDLEVEPDTHSSQLNIQVPENTRNSDLSNILATGPLLTTLVFPAIVLGLLALDLVATGSAAHAESLIRSATAELADCRLCGQEGTAALADPCLGVIGAVEQTILQQESGTVGEQGVALHLSDTDTTTLGTTLDGLTGKWSDGTGGTHLVLVVDSTLR